jgi:LPXTG-motif cell wall-anchored protein
MKLAENAVPLIAAGAALLAIVAVLVLRKWNQHVHGGKQ